MIYSISDLERLSGVQSHTIRMWEQRYNALQPMRSDGNTRLYDDNQLKKLLNIVSLNQSGLKISKICSLSEQVVDELLDEQYNFVSNNEFADRSIAQLIKYGISFDEISFNSITDKCFAELGAVHTYQTIIYPLLVRLGLMWRKDNICPAHEHFITNIIRQKLFAAINETAITASSEKTWLLFLPEDEDHDIGLIFASYMLRMKGQKVIFLGSKVPLDSVEKVFATTKVDHVLLFFIQTRLINAAEDYLQQLTVICSTAQIHLAGNGTLIEKLKNIDHINWFKTLNEFETTIQTTT